MSGYGYPSSRPGSQAQNVGRRSLDNCYGRGNVGKGSQGKVMTPTQETTRVYGGRPGTTMAQTMSHKGTLQSMLNPESGWSLQHPSSKTNLQAHRGGSSYPGQGQARYSGGAQMSGPSCPPNTKSNSRANYNPGNMAMPPTPQPINVNVNLGQMHGYGGQGSSPTQGGDMASLQSQMSGMSISSKAHQPQAQSSFDGLPDEGQSGVQYVKLNWEDILGGKEGIQGMRVSMAPPQGGDAHANRQLRISFGTPGQGQEGSCGDDGSVPLKVVSFTPIENYPGQMTGGGSSTGSNGMSMGGSGPQYSQQQQAYTYNGSPQGQGAQGQSGGSNCSCASCRFKQPVSMRRR